MLPLAIVALVVVPNIAVQFAAAAIGGGCGATVWVAVQTRTLGLRPGQPGTTSAVVGWVTLPAYAFPILVGAVADGAGLTAAMSLYIAATALLVVLLIPVGRFRSAEVPDL